MSPWATVLPLVVVMGVCMAKQVGDHDGGGGGDTNDGDGDYEGVMLDVHYIVTLL